MVQPEEHQYILCHKCHAQLLYSSIDYEYVCPDCKRVIKTVDWHLVNGHYFRTEQRMLEFLEYIVYTSEHKDTWSPKLFDIYLQAGAGIEQAFTMISQWDGFDGIDNIELLRKGEIEKNGSKRFVNIVDWLKAYLDPFRLHEISTSLNYPVYQLSPFKEIDLNGKPVWPDHKLFSQFKHRWYEMVKETRLENTLRFLGAYFTLMCINPLEGNYEYLSSGGIMTPGPQGVWRASSPWEKLIGRSREMEGIRRWILGQIKYHHDQHKSIFQSDLFTLRYPLIESEIKQ